MTRVGNVTIRGLTPIPESPQVIKYRQLEAERIKREAPQRAKDTIRSMDEMGKAQRERRAAELEKNIEKMRAEQTPEMKAWRKQRRESEEHARIQMKQAQEQRDKDMHEL